MRVCERHVMDLCAALDAEWILTRDSAWIYTVIFNLLTAACGHYTGSMCAPHRVHTQTYPNLIPT